MRTLNNKTFGDKRNYRKIDIFTKSANGLEYRVTTTWHKKCQDAADYFAKESKIDRVKIVARFRKGEFRK